MRSCVSAMNLVSFRSINFHEIAQRYRKEGVLGGRERIDAEFVLQARNQDGEAERIETAISQYEILVERRESLAVLSRDLFHLLDYSKFY